LIRLVVDDENGIVFVTVGDFCPMHGRILAIKRHKRHKRKGPDRNQ
jgi:hypothetical protein